MPAPVFFVVGAIAQYVGAALAVGLFDALPPAAVAWLRVAFSAALIGSDCVLAGGADRGRARMPALDLVELGLRTCGGPSWCSVRPSPA